MRRTVSLRCMSISTTSNSRWSVAACARNSPCGPATKLDPQNWTPRAPDVVESVGAASKPIAIAGKQGQTVGDGMAALHGDPGIALARFFRLVVGRIPADRGGVEQQIGAGQRHQACAFGIPLIPADQHAQLADRGLHRLETEIARREVELLVERRVVRNVHFAVFSTNILLRDRTRRRCCDTARARDARTTRRRRRVPSSAASAPIRSRARPRNGFGAIEFGDVSRAGRSTARCAVPAAAPDSHLARRPRAARPRSRRDWRHGCRGRAPATARRAMTCSCNTPCGNCMVMQCRLPFCQIRGRQGTGITSRPGCAARDDARGVGVGSVAISGNEHGAIDDQIIRV